MIFQDAFSLWGFPFLFYISPKINAWQIQPRIHFVGQSASSLVYDNRQFRPLFAESNGESGGEIGEVDLDAILSQADEAIARTDRLLSKGPKLSDEEVDQLGNLVADGEWDGLGMELSEVIKKAIEEDLKANAREFLGKEYYQLGDFSKEIDARVKDEVARFRQKDEYELGDLTAALDQASKELTCQLTGKDDYEFGDLSTEIDSRIKKSVAQYCGKDEYEIGDLSKAIDEKVKDTINDFTNKENYEFGGKRGQILSTSIMCFALYLPSISKTSRARLNAAELNGCRISQERKITSLVMSPKKQCPSSRVRMTTNLATFQRK